MKKHRLLPIFIIVISAICNSLGVCQTIPAKFDIEFKYPSEFCPDTVNIDILKEGNIWEDLRSMYIKINQKKGNFQLSRLTKPTMFNISIVRKGRFERLGRFYAEPNDNVKILISKGLEKDSITFSGRGSEKYALTEKILKLYDDFEISKKALFKSPTESDSVVLDTYLKRWCIFIESWIKKKSSLIDNYEGVEPNIKTLLNHEYFGIYFVWVARLDYLVRYHKNFANNPNFKRQIKSYFDLYNNKFSLKPNSISVLAPIYHMDLVEGLKLGLMLNNPKGTINIVDLYNLLKTNYSGLIRDRLFMELFTGKRTLINIENNKSDIYDSLIVDASKVMMNPYYKSLIDARFKIQKGTKIKYAEFLDLNGNPIKLESLQGKVVLIDVWGTGCSGCAEFHENFKTNILPKINSINNFIILNVCLDKTKEKWLKGLATGRYSSSGDILASTGKLGIDHPFFKYYGFRSIPLVILADKKGKILCKLTGTEDPTYVADLINNELKIADSK